MFATKGCTSPVFQERYFQERAREGVVLSTREEREDALTLLVLPLSLEERDYRKWKGRENESEVKSVECCCRGERERERASQCSRRFLRLTAASLLRLSN